MTAIRMERYLPADSRQDAMPAVRRAMEDVRGMRNPSLVFPPGTWHIWPDLAFEKYCFISNNEHGLKRIAFLITGFDGLSIIGDRTEFILHGRVLPFAVEDSRNITIKGISLDTARPFFTQGRVTDAGPDWVELEIDRNEYPYEVVPGELIFKGENWKSEPDAILLFTEFDAQKREPAWRTFHTQARFRELSATELPGGGIRLNARFKRRCTPGNWLVICHEKRHAPAIFVSRSAGVTLEDLAIRQIGCMGLIAQLSRDITVRRLRVAPREGSGRMVSTNGDATHFVHCTGAIVMEDCVFEGMMDDACNVHGIYTVVSAMPAANQVDVRFMHAQQAGVPIYAAGDRLAFVARAGLFCKAWATVEQVEALNCAITRLTLDQAVPSGVGVGDAVEIPGKMPDVTIRRCRSGNNRPRGFLLTTPGHVLIEECEFHNAQHGIHIAGDANYWYESGPVQDVTIRGCRFRECGYGFGGVPIAIEPSIKDPPTNGPFYHRNIVIEENCFEVFADGVVRAVSVDGLRYRNNRLRRSAGYAPWEPARPEVEAVACKALDVEPACNGTSGASIQTAR